MHMLCIVLANCPHGSCKHTFLKPGLRAFVNGAFIQFNFFQDSARFPSSLPGEKRLKHTEQALICSGKTPHLAHCAKHGDKNKWRLHISFILIFLKSLSDVESFFLFAALSILLPLKHVICYVNLENNALEHMNFMLNVLFKQKFAKSLPKFAPFLLELSSLLKSLILLNNKSNTLLSHDEKFFPEATVWTMDLSFYFSPSFFFKLLISCILIWTLSCTANLKEHIELTHLVSLSRHVQVNKKNWIKLKKNK